MEETFKNICQAENYRLMLFHLSKELEDPKSIKDIKDLCKGKIAGGTLKKLETSQDVFNKLHEHGAISENNLEYLTDTILKNMQRTDLIKPVKDWTDRRSTPGHKPVRGQRVPPEIEARFLVKLPEGYFNQTDGDTSTGSMGGSTGGGQGTPHNVHIEGVYAPGMQVQGNVAAGKDHMTVNFGGQNPAPAPAPMKSAQTFGGIAAAQPTGHWQTDQSSSSQTPPPPEQSKVGGRRKGADSPSTSKSKKPDTQNPDPSIELPRHLMLLCDEWASSKGGLSTFNRDLAVNLAEVMDTEGSGRRVSCLVADRDAAEVDRGVTLLPLPKIPGLDLHGRLVTAVMGMPAKDRPDVVVGHGRITGPAAMAIQEMTGCKRLHFLHVAPNLIGMNKVGKDAIEDNEGKNKVELDLCRDDVTLAAVGPRLKEYYQRYFRAPEKNIYSFVPGLNRELQEHSPSEEELVSYEIFIICRGEEEDRELKGMDIAAKTMGKLYKIDPDFASRVRLTYVGAQPGQHDSLRQWFKEKGVPIQNLTIMSYKKEEELHGFIKSNIDLLLVPSREEGFGMIALEALSAATPFFISKQSGLAWAMEEEFIGENCIIDAVAESSQSDNSEEAEALKWAKEIKKELSKKPRRVRIRNAKDLRRHYHSKYTWEKACIDLFKNL